jgi:hypothetical protein
LSAGPLDCFVASLLATTNVRVGTRREGAPLSPPYDLSSITAGNGSAPISSHRYAFDI